MKKLHYSHLDFSSGCAAHIRELSIISLFILVA